MIGVTALLILLLIICKFLASYIKVIRTGDNNESNLTYWMFSYDFKSNKKEDFSPDKPKILRRRRFRNRLVFLLYIDVIAIFFLVNILTAQILEKIIN